MTSKDLFYVEKEALRPSENLAINGYLADQINNDEFDTIVRFYKHQPGVIIGANESLEDVYKDNCEDLGFEVVRRPTGGSAVVVDNTALCYSIFSRYDAKKNDIHDIYKSIVLPLVNELGNNFSVEGNYYLRFKGQPIAGHALKTHNNCVQFDGIVNTERVDSDLISRLIKLRDSYTLNGEDYVKIGEKFYDLKGNEVSLENPVFVKSEKKALEELVGLKDAGLSEDVFINIFYNSLKQKNSSLEITPPLKYEQKEIKKRIGDLERELEDGSRKMKNLGHCFIDLIEKEEAL